MSEHHDARVLAAAFLAEALALPDPPFALAADLVAIEDDGAVAVFAAELDSSIGPAAFLVYVYDVYVYDVDRSDDAERTGRARFEADVEILRTAAERDAPGPRLVAHALTDAAGLLLATTPATVRALAGEATASTPNPPIGTSRDVDPLRTRADAATELLRLLRAAEGEAAVWLTVGGAATTAGDFLPEEAALALFLLDDRSIRSLLTILDRILSAARENAAGALGDRD